MKKLFIEKRFTPESRDLLEKIMAILEKYSAQGYDLSLRQLYYQLVAGNLLPEKWADPATGSTNSERSYKNVGSLVSDARLAGLIDWDMIADRGRVVAALPHWENPGEILKGAASQFRIDKWAHQPARIEVMVEKQALEGVLEPVCRELDISFMANKGYSSSSALFEAGRRMRNAILDEKTAHVIYLGDHDPSGIDMTRDVEDRLYLFAEEDRHTEMLQVYRVALNFEQIKKLRPPKNPAKMTDSRAADYVSNFGTSSWELDAIEPSALAKLVRDKVYEIRDPDIWEKSVKREDAMKAELVAFAKKSKWANE